MDLKMFIKEKLIDSTQINVLKLNIPGYLNSLKAEMEEKNEEILDLSKEEPQFFIDAVPSSMNFYGKLFEN